MEDLNCTYPHGNTLKHFLNEMESTGNDILIESIGEMVGKTIASVHNTEMIHGDLTTSNLFITDTRINNDTLKFDIFIIDLGLAQTTQKEEDRAVDIYVMERANESAHPLISKKINEYIIKAYMQFAKSSDNTFKRLENVRARGRKRCMAG